MPFVKGKSGNPAGVTKEALAIKALALKACPEAIAGLIELSKHSRDERTRVAAYKEILDRGLGKSSAGIELSGPNGKDLPISIVIGTKVVTK